MTVPLSRADAPVSAPDERAELIEALFAVIPQLRRRLGNNMPAEIREKLSRWEASVTWHQIEALGQLTGPGQSSSGLTMGELAKTQHCAMSTATALVDRLISQGLAERHPDPVDRRVIRIAPTAEGANLLAVFAAGKRRMFQEALSVLNDRDLATLVRLLTKIAHD